MRIYIWVEDGVLVGATAERSLKEPAGTPAVQVLRWVRLLNFGVFGAGLLEQGDVCVGVFP